MLLHLSIIVDIYCWHLLLFTFIYYLSVDIYLLCRTCSPTIRRDWGKYLNLAWPQCVQAYFGTNRCWKFEQLTVSFGGQNPRRSLALMSFYSGFHTRISLSKRSTACLWVIINIHPWIRHDKTIKIWLLKDCLYIHLGSLGSAQY